MLAWRSKGVVWRALQNLLFALNAYLITSFEAILIVWLYAALAPTYSMRMSMSSQVSRGSRRIMNGTIIPASRGPRQARSECLICRRFSIITGKKWSWQRVNIADNWVNHSSCVLRSVSKRAKVLLFSP